MGPKGKKEVKPEPEINDEVTELEKQVYEIQLQDITRKIERLVARQEELKQKTIELEEKAEECKRENGFVIAEEEQTLIQREEEKILKREETMRLSKEMKLRVEKHKKHIEELEKKYEDLVREKMRTIESLTEQARALEDFKQNKEGYGAELESLERHLTNGEVEHQRRLFNIERKGEIAKVRLKRELETKLLTLSIDFQQVYQKKVGDSCHRMTLENKAIEGELRMMREELEEYREKQKRATINLQAYKTNQAAMKMECDKAVARTILQKVVIGDLLKDRMNVLEILSGYASTEVEHKSHLKRLRTVEAEKHRQLFRIKELNLNIDSKVEDTNILKDAVKGLRKCSRKLQILIKNGLKIIDEAAAVRLIPAGGMEEEKYLTNDAKVRLFKKRREAVFNKKGKILQYAFEFFAKAEFTEEEVRLLRLIRAESINLEEINFTLIYGRKPSEDLEHKESPTGSSLVFGYHLASDASLPRSASAIIRPVGAEVEEEGEEEEGEEEEEDGAELKEAAPKAAESAESVGEGEGDLYSIGSGATEELEAAAGN